MCIIQQEDERRREPILNVQDLIQAVLADIESDPTCLQTLKNSFKRLLQTHRTCLFIYFILHRFIHTSYYIHGVQL